MNSNYRKGSHQITILAHEYSEYSAPRRSPMNFKTLLSRCHHEDKGIIITRQRWRWLGNMLRKDLQSTTQQEQQWNPEGKTEKERDAKSR